MTRTSKRITTWGLNEDTHVMKCRLSGKPEKDQQDGELRGWEN